MHVDVGYFFEGLDEIVSLAEKECKLNGGEINPEMLNNIFGMEKFGSELRKLNRNFLKIKNSKMRGAIVKLAKWLANCEDDDCSADSEKKNDNINKK